MIWSRRFPIFIVLYGVLAVASDTDVATITIEECAIAGVSLGESKDLARYNLGAPNESGPVCDSCFDIMESWYVYDGLKLNFLQEELIMYSVTSAKYRLSSGIGVGSTSMEVQSTYGKPVHIESEDQDILRYPATHENRATAFKLDFWVQENRVTKIEFHPGN